MADFQDDPFADIPDDDPFADLQSVEPTVTMAKPTPKSDEVQLTEKPGTVSGYTEKYYKTGLHDIKRGALEFLAGIMKPRVSPEGDVDFTQTGEQVRSAGRVAGGGIRSALSLPSGLVARATVPAVQWAEQQVGAPEGIASKPLEELIPDIIALFGGPLAKGRAQAKSRALEGEFPGPVGGKWTPAGTELLPEGKLTPQIPVTPKEGPMHGPAEADPLSDIVAYLADAKVKDLAERNQTPAPIQYNEPVLPTGKPIAEPGLIDAGAQEPWFPKAGGPMPRDIMAEPKAYPKGTMADARLRAEGGQAVRSQARHILERDAEVQAAAEKARYDRLFPKPQEPTRITRTLSNQKSIDEGPVVNLPKSEYDIRHSPTSGGAQPGDITEMHAGLPFDRQKVKDYIKSLPGVERLLETTSQPRAYLVGPSKSDAYLTQTRGAKGATAEAGYRVQDLATGMDRAISKAIKNESWAHGFTKQDVRVRAALALHGNPSAIPRDSAVGQAFEKARGIIDELTKMKRERGLISEAAAAVPNYVRRLYARDVMGGDEWSRLIPDSIKSKGVDYILQNEQIKVGKEWRSVTLEEAKAIADSIIKEGHTGQFANRVRSPYQIKPGQLKSRKDIPKEIRGLMGEIDDGVYLAARTIHDGSNLVIMHDFLKSFAKGSDTIKGMKAEWLSPTPRMGYTRVKVNDYTRQAMGKNAKEDVYILDKYADDFSNAFGGSNVDNASVWDKVFSPLNTMFKSAKTVYNPATHGRNVIGNLVFASGAGNSLFNPMNIRYYATALKEAFNGGQLYTEALRSGTIGAEFAPSELKLLADTYYRSKGDWISFFKNLSVESVAKSITNNPAGRALGKAYTLEDQVFKLASYAKQRQLGMAPEEASLHVNKFFPRYDELSQGVRALNKTMGGVFGSPFASFSAESIRIAKNMMAERPFTFSAWLFGVPALSYGAKAMLGLSDAEMQREFNRIPPELRSKVGTWIMPFKDADGNVQFIDTTYWHPFGQFLKGAVDKDLMNRLIDLPIVSDFVGGNPVVNMAIEIATNQQLSPFRRGEPVRRPSQGVEAYLQHFVKTMAPPLLPGGTGARQIGAAWEGKPGRFGQRKSVTEAAIGEVTPFRVTSIDPNLSKFTQGLHKSEVRRVDEDLRRLTNEFRKGKIKQSEYRTGVNNILDAQRKIRESFYGQ